MREDKHLIGRITQGISPDTTIRKTLQFVEAQLPAWRDMPERPEVEAEDDLNGQLCKYLNFAARHENFSMAYFHHEERQTGRRRVDLSALPPERTVIEGRNYCVLEPFLVLEGKRLPLPTRDREREYVTGVDNKSGGIQRFKLGLHGASLRHAGMIGYIQKESFDIWHNSINEWIEELATSDSLWSSDDRLGSLDTDSETRIACCFSIHARRASELAEIQLTHLWVDMGRRDSTKRP